MSRSLGNKGYGDRGANESRSSLGSSLNGGNQNSNQASFRAQRQKEGTSMPPPSVPGALIDSRSHVYVPPTYLPQITSKALPVSNTIHPSPSRYEGVKKSQTHVMSSQGSRNTGAVNAGTHVVNAGMHMGSHNVSQHQSHYNNNQSHYQPQNRQSRPTSQQSGQNGQIAPLPGSQQSSRRGIASQTIHIRRSSPSHFQSDQPSSNMGVSINASADHGSPIVMPGETKKRVVVHASPGAGLHTFKGVQGMQMQSPHAGPHTETHGNQTSPQNMSFKWLPQTLSAFERSEIQLYDPSLLGCGDVNAFHNANRGTTVDRNRASEFYVLPAAVGSQVFYAGHNRPHNHHLQINDTFPHAESYSTAQHTYRVTVGDHVAYRYEVVRLLGKGSFGIVVLCKDHAAPRNSPTHVALKIMKKRTVESQSVQREKEVLGLCVGGVVLSGSSVAAKSGVTVNENPLFTAQLGARLRCEDHVVNAKQFFRFRGFECIVLELLHLNLYQFLKQNHFHLEEKAAITLVHSALLAAFVLHSKNVVHCDLKPENLLLTVSTPPNGQVLLADLKLKVVDFGTSWVQGREAAQFYIQSRFYRAPEILLELPYDGRIDVFSIGCMVSELITGQPLFVSGNELEHIYRLMELLGPPPPEVVRHSKKRPVLISNQGLLLSYDPARVGKAVPASPAESPIQPYGSLQLHKVLKYNNVTYDYTRLSSIPLETFNVKDPKDANLTLYPYTKVPSELHGENLLKWLIVDFIWCCLSWDYKRRMTAAQALRHPLMMRAFKFQEGIIETNAISDYVHTVANNGYTNQPNQSKQTNQTNYTHGSQSYSSPHAQQLPKSNTFPHQRRVM